MSYIVMECHSTYAILLDEEGRFLKAANLHYEVGQTVFDPVLMREEKTNTQSLTIRFIGGIAAIAACFLLLIGIGYYQNHIAAYSSIYLVINPEVQMDLNRQGVVVALTGTNEDGIALLEGYNSKGKDKVTVADELIDRAIEMGFLSEGGQVSFSIDTPDDVLFQEYGVELRSNITEHLDGRITITVEIFNHRSEQSSSSSEETTNPNQQVNASPAGQDESIPPSNTEETSPTPNSDRAPDHQPTASQIPVQSSQEHSEQTIRTEEPSRNDPDDDDDDDPDDDDDDDHNDDDRDDHDDDRDNNDDDSDDDD